MKAVLPTRPQKPAQNGQAFNLLQHKQSKQALLDAAAQQTGASQVRSTLKKLTQWADTLLVHLWQQHGLEQHGAGSAFALVALGGFGRCELYPHSDVDILIVLPDATDEQDAAQKLEPFIRACWDAGLNIGSNVRTLAQCRQADHTMQTALLDRRLVCGNNALFAQLGNLCGKLIKPYAFYRAKLQEMHARHARFNHTPYALEPDCKESPGGLRDLHTVLWIAQAVGLGRDSHISWQMLTQQRLITPYELRRITRHHTLLQQIRMQLHLCAKRGENRLLFDLQSQVAQILQPHQAADAKQHPTKPTLRPSELLMRRYYKAAKGITQISTILLLNLAEYLRSNGLANHTKEAAQAAPKAERLLAKKPTLEGNTASAATDYLAAFKAQQQAEQHAINARFLNKQGLVDVAHDNLYHEQPQAILETFLLYQQTGMRGLSARTLRALYNARPAMNRAWRNSPATHMQFLQILQAPHGVTHALRLMNQTSVLGRYLPPFRRIVGQMQHDLFHAYTVDQHTLMVLRNVRNFFNPEKAHEHPLCAQLAAHLKKEWKKKGQEPWFLAAAALFHDIAKGRGGDHSVLGEQEVYRFAKQHRIDTPTTDLIAFLVREHLSLSQCAQKQDLGDPAVIARFAELVQTEERLTALYLLTVADIRATAPWVWTEWKGRLLEDLYRLTLNALGKHLPSRQEQVHAICEQALAVLKSMNDHASPTEQKTIESTVQSLWQTLDERYFLRHDADTLAWHAQQLLVAHFNNPNSKKTVVKARPAPQGGGLEVLVYTANQQALFARICGYFAQAGFSILDARIHTSTDGIALDTLQITRPQWADDEAAYTEYIQSIEQDLTQTLEKRTALPPLRTGRLSRRAKSFPRQPNIVLAEQKNSTTKAESATHNWLLTIHATDRQGLLYLIARVLAKQKADVLLAKISTMGERVEDSFLIAGQALANAAEREKLKQALFNAIAAEAPNDLFLPLSE